MRINEDKFIFPVTFSKNIGMILNWMLLLWFKLDLCSSSPKAGIPGIKIKPANSLDDTTEYPELHAVIGSTVYLPCSLSPPSADDAILLVLWYRVDLPNPIYTLDTRSVPEAKHFSSKVLGTRAYFNVTRRSTAHLRLDPVEEDDEGEYRCRIDYKRGRTLNRLVKLNVIVPVKKVLIKNREGNITYAGVIGPFTEGEKLILVCEAVGGRPRPYVFWRKGASVMQGTITVDGNGAVRNELVFERLKREDLLTVLVCQASNNNFTSPVYASVTIDLNLKPMSVQITVVPGTLVAEEILEINCQSEGSKPPATITWTKGSDSINHLAIQNIYGSISVSSLSFEVAAEDNGKKLVCRAQNPHLPESALQDSTVLSVQYPPQLSLVFGASLQYEHIREGSDVYFECNIQANPPVTEVRWKFQNRNLVHEPLTGVIVKNHSLLLHNVSRRNRGTYQCVAVNTRGRGKSEEVTLRIQHTPICSGRQEQTYGIPRQGKNNISCIVDADPTEVSFTWTLNATNVMRELGGYRSFETLSGAKSIIEYQPITKVDYGAVLCHAKNSIGHMREPCIFHIVPTGPPAPLLNCTVNNQTISSLLVSCENNDNPRQQQSYHLEIYDTNGEQLLYNLTSIDEPYFSVRGLPAGSTFILALYTSTSKGRSETVALTASTQMSSDGDPDMSSGSVVGAVLLISLAALGVLAILAIAAALAVAKNKTGHPTHEVVPPGTEMIEKTPKTSKPSFEDGNPYVYHTTEVPTEYVHLTPKTASECLYESLMDGNPKSYENVLCKAHALTEEGMEVIIPVIER